jgi:glycosyltransferase involved in cell wall biosynthesis
MRVIVHPADRHGCGSYRLIFPTEALIAQGYNVALEQDTTYRAQWQPCVFGDRIIGLDEDVEADVVVLQRPMHRNRVELIDALQAQGVAVVVEIDDDFHSIHRRNAAWLASSPLENPDANRDWLMRACKRADLVTVTTPALAKRYGAHGRVAVLPNYIPAKYLTCEPAAYTDEYLERLTGTVAGWTGSVATHPDDLEATGGAIPDALTLTGARFHVVGTGMKVAQCLGLTEKPTSTGWVPIEAYPEAIRQIDVGIVPLAAHPFNEAKSALKMSEFAALGVPPIVTPTTDNRRMNAAGIGFLASTPADWYELTSRLLSDVVLREEMSIQGREIMASFTYEGNAWRWFEAWSRALSHRRGTVAA